MNTLKFKFDKKLKLKEYSSKYFISTQKIFKENNLGNDVTLRFFHFNDTAMVCGIEETIQLLKFCLTKKEFNSLQIWYEQDGSIIEKEKPVLIIRGNYQYFGHLENVIDGILSRRSSVANNCYRIINEIQEDKLLLMADRSDDYSLQKYDGYAAYIGGVKNFCTKQHIELIKNKSDVNYLGTVPHALIQQFNGQIDKALIAYQQSIKEGPIVALIDYNNDCLSEIQKIAKLPFKIDSIRIDTSNKIVDKSLQVGNWKNKKELYGVCDKLILACRKELDKYNMHNTKIIVSSGINIDKIKHFKKNKIPVDFFGVGKSLLEVNVHFTGDLIKSNENYQAKFGRNNNIDNLIVKMKKI